MVDSATNELSAVDLESSVPYDIQLQELLERLEAQDKPAPDAPPSSGFHFEVPHSARDISLHPRPGGDAMLLVQQLRDMNMIPPAKGDNPLAFNNTRVKDASAALGGSPEATSRNLVRIYNLLKAAEAREKFQKERADRAEGTLERIKGEMEFHYKGMRDRNF